MCSISYVAHRGIDLDLDCLRFRASPKLHADRMDDRSGAALSAASVQLVCPLAADGLTDTRIGTVRFTETQTSVREGEVGYASRPTQQDFPAQVETNLTEINVFVSVLR